MSSRSNSIKRSSPDRAVLFLFGVLALAGTSALAKSPGSPSQASKSEMKAQDFANVRLPSVQSLGIRYSVKARKLDPSITDSKDNYHLEIELDAMSPEQFTTLSQKLGGSGTVPYQKGAKYALSDFMSPKIQAIIGKTFESRQDPSTNWSIAFIQYFNEERSAPPRSEAPLYTASNCYNTAWELSREDERSFSSWWASESKVAKVFSSPEYSVPVSKDELMNGDLVLFYNDHGDGDRSLLHVVRFVDGDLCIEKGDTLDIYPYRMALLKDVHSKYEHAVTTGDPSAGGEGKFVVEYLRIGGPGTRKLPHVSERLSMKALGIGEDGPVSFPEDARGKLIFGFSPVRADSGRMEPDFYRIEDAPIIIDQKTGRGKLDPASPASQYFKPLP